MLLYAYQDDLKILNNNLTTISNNTSNTWEAKRNQSEINKNTLQGKIVEEFFIDFIEYLNTDVSKKRKLSYIPYDSIRLDEFKKHAPFDGLLFEKNNPYVNEIIDEINKHIHSDNFGKLPNEMFQLCRDKKIFMVEIKSSKIPDYIINNIYQKKTTISPISQEFHIQIFESLTNLDLFKYPKFNRTNGNLIHNSGDYLSWVKKTIPNMRNQSDDTILKEEIVSSLDIYTRIFVNDSLMNKENKKLFIGYFMGYAHGFDFYKNFKIMNFPSKKSKDAIYVTYPIKKSINLARLSDDTLLWGE